MIEGPSARHESGQLQYFTPHAAGAQIIGNRERQEDFYATLDLSKNGHSRLIFIVADGMGGHPRAAEVARLAVERFSQCIQGFNGPVAQRLRYALDSANDAIAMAATRDATFEGAGCAFLCAAIEDYTLSWISVGDCSLLLFRDGKLRQLNDDHSMRPIFAEMVAAGRLSASAASRDPRRGSLRSALAGKAIRLVDVSMEPLTLRTSDSILLASDGLDTLKGPVLVGILKRAAELHASIVVERLLAAVEAARSRHQDNVTIIFSSLARPKGRLPLDRRTKGLRSTPWKFRLILAIMAASILVSATIISS